MQSKTDCPQDRRHLVYVRKHWNAKSGWSDAIGKHFSAMVAQHASGEMFEVHTSSPLTLLKQAQQFYKICTSRPASEIVVAINHSICWWLLFPALVLLKKRGLPITLYMHEHEHILGIGFCIQNAKALKFKEWLRYSRLYHTVPARMSSQLVVLSEPQAFCIGVTAARQINFLKIDGQVFHPRPVSVARSEGRKAIALFPHDPARYDKGARFIKPVEEMLGSTLSFSYGRSINLPYEEVYKKYWNADLIFLPSDWESYSLVAIEAMACNIPMVVSPYIGIIRTLSHKYSRRQLEYYGIFISEHDEKSYADTVRRLIEQLDNGFETKTRHLFEEFKLADHNDN